MIKRSPNIGAEVRASRLLRQKFPKGSSVELTQKGVEQGVCATRSEPVIGTVWGYAAGQCLLVIVGSSAPERYHWSYWRLIL
jgi:hypothetical protein